SAGASAPSGGGGGGGFFPTALGKAGGFSAQGKKPPRGGGTGAAGTGGGGRGGHGSRGGGPGPFLGPVAGAGGQNPHTNGAAVAGASFNWSDASSSKGELGARLGGVWGPLKPYLGAYWVDQWSGNNKLNVLFGGACPSCMSIEDTPPGQYGRAAIGF